MKMGDLLLEVDAASVNQAIAQAEAQYSNPQQLNMALKAALGAVAQNPTAPMPAETLGTIMRNAVSGKGAPATTPQQTPSSAFSQLMPSDISGLMSTGPSSQPPPSGPSSVAGLMGTQTDPNAPANVPGPAPQAGGAEWAGGGTSMATPSQMPTPAQTQTGAASYTPPQPDTQMATPQQLAQYGSGEAGVTSQGGSNAAWTPQGGGIKGKLQNIAAMPGQAWQKVSAVPGQAGQALHRAWDPAAAAAAQATAPQRGRVSVPVRSHKKSNLPTLKELLDKK